MLARIGALCAIFACTSVAWWILGATMFSRTSASQRDLTGKVASVWGSPQEQKAPSAMYALDSTNGATGALTLETTRLRVALDLDHRQKGLLWYSTYRVNFHGSYVFHNDTAESHLAVFQLPLPATQALYDDLTVTVDGRAVETRSSASAITAQAHVPPGASVTLAVGYRSQGLESWKYSFGENVSKVRDFSLQLRTNFREPDFPENSLAPTAKRLSANGWDLEWTYRNLVSGFQIAVVCPEKLQPGPLAGEIIYFAPVSLFFFFFLMFIITTIRDIDLHPMNYFFLATAFFAFHLLLAYLVDHISIHLSFAISSAVSIALVVSYLRLVVGLRFAMREAALVQFVYLVLFSYAFFFKGFTGLSITIGSIATLFVVMQVTGRINWQDQFRRFPPALPAH